ncbi:hypothetical protein CONCODRAFT_11550 [Conidiobolus coronatus NRRL 28638]|uniref:F-box domain-containing protein n=1 Tax=Conidiobolus coronatus (strain ATCC 28846 / CBS 209.66 / NRRL 28638) TaxID=796925 RepID=A0A137NUS3_CONC2|nr:hypothetical protein CONCODRAFT_11550 [Conidiobolus coronatus NRRL 28638]|eukprot:KXN66565.1 hypothetical protein CONCODRAFT_11550 [Conidiobolus coronatus NRRL 28638]
MSTENNNFNIKEANWKYFPNIYQLSQYLLQSDLIQLSLACSQLRSKLNSIIFRKLKLFSDEEMFLGKANSTNKEHLDILVDILREDYYEKYHFVKHCILMKPCDNTFNIKFFKIFSYITKLELYLDIIGVTNAVPNIGDGFSLVNILKPLKKLEILKLNCELINFSEDDSILNFKLPTFWSNRKY